MTKRLLEIASEIVQTQVSMRQMTSEEIVISLRQVFNTLQGMQKSEINGSFVDLGKLTDEPSVEGRSLERLDPKDSIQEDKIVCLECGAEMRQLTTKHLSAHDLNPREYKKKWGFTLRQSLSAKSLSRARSKAAKKRGLPENLVKYQEEKKLKKAEMASLEMNSQAEQESQEMESKGGDRKRSRKKNSE